MRRMVAAFGAILILLAAAGCDLEVPPMPMVGEEAGGGSASPSQDDDANVQQPSEPPGARPPIWTLPLSFGPAALLIVAAIIGALLITRSRGRKRE